MRKLIAISFLTVAFIVSTQALASDISSLIKDLGNKEKAKDASNALAKIGKPAVPELIDAMKGSNNYQKRYAARAIREMGQTGSDAIPVLENLLKDWDTQTREYAVEALGKMTQQAEFVKLILGKATEDRDRSVREKARIAIENLLSTKIQVEQNNIGNDDAINKYTFVPTDTLHTSDKNVYEEASSKTIINDANTSISKTNRKNTLLDFWNSTITIGQWETNPAAITIIVFIVMLIIIVAIAIKKTNDGVVIFFSSYFDLFLSFLPFIVFAVSLIVVSSQSETKNKEIPNWSIYTVIIVAVLYNYVKAYFDNRHTKFLAFCVGTGRITLGYLLPIIIILNLLELLSSRRERESTDEFIFRKTMAGLMLWGTTVFLHNLIGSSRRNFDFAEEQYEQPYDNDEYYEENGHNGHTHPQYEPNFSETKNPYEVLKVSQHATKEEIKDAYRKLAQQYHPDKTMQLGQEIQEVAHKKMQEINKAYEILMKSKTSKK